ncbi:MAG TPA: CoA-binding protein, partial [Chroococcales cyanobacterium]
NCFVGKWVDDLNSISGTEEKIMDNLDKQIDAFLKAPAFAVVGASDDKSKYGHKVYKCCLDHGLKAYPVNPNAETVMGNPAYASLSELPEKVEAISIITPPKITEKVVDEAIKAGVKHIWMQPGAESLQAVEHATKSGVSCVYGGACLLIVLGYRE